MATSTSTGKVLDRASALPLWAQLHADLLRRIEEDEFRAEFPGELALVQEYGVSRHTVREALRRLREDGVVTAERGRLPRVALPAEILHPVGSLYRQLLSGHAPAQGIRSVVLVLDTRIDAEVAARLGLNESTPLVHLERLRLAGEEPLAVDHIWLPARVASPLLQVDFEECGLYAELKRRCGITLTDGQETIHAVQPTAFERRMLAIPRGSVAFCIYRLRCAHGVAVEWRKTLVRGDKFAIVAKYSARSGYKLDLSVSDASSESQKATRARTKDTPRTAGKVG